MTSESLVDSGDLEVSYQLVAGEAAYVGVPLPIRATVRVSASSSGSYSLRAVSSADVSHFEADDRLLDREIRVFPGESYAVTFSLVPRRPGPLDLAKIELQVVPPEGRSFLVPVERGTGALLNVLPQMFGENGLRIEVTPVRRAGESVKLLLTLQNLSSSPITDLTLSIPDAADVSAGKTIARFPSVPTGQSGGEVFVYVSSALSMLRVVASGEVDGMRTKGETRLPIEAVQDEEDPYRFLNPQQLSRDLIHFYRIESAALIPIKSVLSEYPMPPGEGYLLSIRPPDDEATQPVIAQAPWLAVTPRGRQGDAWTYRLDVVAKESFSTPATISYSYESSTPGGGSPETRYFDIPVRLDPHKWKHARTAFAFGIALTVQGFMALTKFLQGFDFEMEDVFARAWVDQPKIGFLLSMPVVYLGFMIGNRVYYRIRHAE